MKQTAKILCCILAALCLLTGCVKKNGNSGVELPEPTERTIVLEEEKLQVENVSPYTGIYIEQGDDENKDRVTDVCALTFTNTAQETISTAELVFTDGRQKLHFYLEMLPYGSSTTVVEYDQKAIRSDELELVSSEITYLQVGLEDKESIEVTADEYGSIIVENLTLVDLPYVEIYYRRSYEGGTLGGPCHVVTVKELGPKEIVLPEAEDWSNNSEVVNVLLYPDIDDAE